MPTTYKASEFRHCNVLPAALIDKVAGRGVRAIRLGTITPGEKWWEYEGQVEIDFADSREDDRPMIANKCRTCGQCCNDIPSHQIGIYMSPHEVAIAAAHGHSVKSQGTVTVDGVEFRVLDIKPNGDCAMLGPEGCTLGKQKPLWCKIYHCEKFAGAQPPWMSKDQPQTEYTPNP